MANDRDMTWSELLGLQIPLLKILACGVLISLPVLSEAKEVATEATAKKTGSQELRDPTRPLNFTVPKVVGAKKKVALNSVLISEQRKLAVINGKALMGNQSHDGVKVVKISLKTNRIDERCC